MRLRLRSATLFAAAFALLSCAERTPTGPSLSRPGFSHTGSHPSVRFSEIHYDNAGTDTGERIEVSGPAGTDLTGWSIVLYNGNGGAAYDTDALSGIIADQCDGRGTVVLAYPSNGIQNGNPDGFALVNPAGVVEFLTYGGTFTAVGGPANGMTGTNIGVNESSTTPAGSSLGRNGDGTWSAAAPNTFGACNDADEPPAAVASVVVAPEAANVFVGATTALTATAYDAVGDAIGGVSFTWTSSDTDRATVDGAGVVTGVAAGTVTITATAPNGVFDTAPVTVDDPPPPSGEAPFFSEIHYDNDGTDTGEAIEIEGVAGTSLSGWSIVLYNGSNNAVYLTTALSGVIPDLCTGRGVVVVNYPANGIQNGSPDGFALVNPAGQAVQFLSYEGTLTAAGGPANGQLSVDIGASEGSSSPIGQALQRDADGLWLAARPNTFGACNGDIVTASSFTFTGRSAAGDPPLPVGFQDQLFVTVRDPFGNPVAGTITWSSDTPALASIDQNGVMTALAAGSAVFRATTDAGESDSYTLPLSVATAGGTAQYAGNTEFGEPADGTAADDIIVLRDQYTASYNPVRNIPNWVSYEFDVTHFGAEDRCDCFTFDPALPSGLATYTTANYTGAGAYHGYGIDRGHLARSFDRTTGSLDNATTYYFTNIIPQAADNNQGPWAALESYLGDLARFQNREVYVVAGASGSKGTVKDEGIITIPSATWKVALILPRDQGLANVDAYDDVEVIAVIMPNDAGIRNVAWETYRTTVDEVEALSGYDLLALLPDQVEIAVESGTRPPVAAVDGPYSGFEHVAIAMSAAASSDPDGDALTIGWDFGDGQTGSGADVTHAWAAGGTYTVTVVVTDTRGLVDSAVTMVTVSTPAQGAQQGVALVEQLRAAGTLNAGNANSLISKLEAAAASFGGGNATAGVNQLEALLNELDAMVRSRRLTDADAAPLRGLVAQLIQSATA